MKKVLVLLSFIVLALFFMPCSSQATNETTGRVWTLDTPGVITLEMIFIEYILWVRPTNVGDVAELTNAAESEDIWTDEVGTDEAGRSRMYYIYDRWLGLKLVTLDSGVLEIKLRLPPDHR